MNDISVEKNDRAARGLLQFVFEQMGCRVENNKGPLFKFIESGQCRVGDSNTYRAAVLHLPPDFVL